METGDLQLPRPDATLPKDIVNFSQSYHRLIEPILRLGDPKDLADILAEQKIQLVKSNESDFYSWINTRKIAEHCLEYDMVPDMNVYTLAKETTDNWINNMDRTYGRGNWIDVEIQYVDKKGQTHDPAVFAFVKRSALAQSAHKQQFRQAERLADNPQMEWGMNVDYPETVIKRTPRFRKEWWDKHVAGSIGEGKRFQTTEGNEELLATLRTKLSKTEEADKSRDPDILVIGGRKRDEGWSFVSDTTGGGIYAYRESNPTRGRQVFRDRYHVAVDCIKVK